MRRPGRGDTLVKIASLGGGGIAIGGNLQQTADRDKKIKEELKKAKADDAAYETKIKKIKMKYAKKQLEETKGERK